MFCRSIPGQPAWSSIGTGVEEVVGIEEVAEEDVVRDFVAEVADVAVLVSELAQIPRESRMRELSIKRQNQMPLLKKAKWALYEEKHFKRLIEDVTDLVNDLKGLFPGAQASQRELCELEVKELGTGQNLALLKDIAAGQDMELEAANLRVEGQGGVINT